MSEPLAISHRSSEFQIEQIDFHYTFHHPIDRKEYDLACADANVAYTKAHGGNLLTVLNQARARLDTALNKVQNAEDYVCSIELDLDIPERWTSTTPQYQRYHQENVITTYRRALDELERLVVMRMFELAKISTSGTGGSFH